MKRSKLFLITFLGVLAALAYLAASSPGRVVVTESGDIQGVANTLRAEIQGQRFWKDQLQIARTEIKMLEDLPRREAQWNAKLDSIMSDFYAKYPNAKPSPAEQRAEELRDEADRIEQEELTKWLQEQRINRTLKLKRISRMLEYRVAAPS